MMYHTRSIQAVLRALGTTQERGLSLETVRQRQEEQGQNLLERPKRQGHVRRFFAQLKDPMILLLLVAAGLSIYASGGRDFLDAGIILFIVLINAVLSIVQEDNAQKALDALEQLAAPKAKVLRGGIWERVPAADLVVGDIIQVKAGDLVPADARLLQATALRVDESAMTGESLPVHKDATCVLGAETPLAERNNGLLSASTIRAGHALAVVTAIGMQTEVGRIAKMLLSQEKKTTPLQGKMGEISKVLSLICLAVCAILFGTGVLQHRPLHEMLMTAVSLAVAAIPEGLPAIVSIVLAFGMARMAKEQVIVKTLPATETLGCASVICTDKTGTLTQNQMQITELWPAQEDLRKYLLARSLLCNNASMDKVAGKRVFSGDPTEVAFLDCAAGEAIFKKDMDDACPRLGELPFDSGKKYMSTRHRVSSGVLTVMKGAPEVVLSHCSRLRTTGGDILLTRAERERIRAVYLCMAGRALRVLGVAEREEATDSGACAEEGLTFLGLAGMIDPPRVGVKEAVARCHSAGVRPVMLTGDHPVTALAIAKDLEIYRAGDLSITGEDLDFLPQTVLESDIARYSVFARVTPAHKLRIVEAWQARGQVVAMTGDGVNDAPALKRADIGCAMGRSGTDVAKSAADMILTDDNFASVVEAVRQGRGVYANIKKSIHYLLSCNIGEIITIFVATLLHFPEMPLTPVQLLWLNLVTDSFPALALGVEPVEERLMQAPPREAKEPLFGRAFSLRLFRQGLLIGGVTLFAYWFSCVHMGGVAVANTVAFATLTLSQLFHAFDVRSEETALYKLGFFSNSAMNKACLAGLVLSLGVLCYAPLQLLFGIVPLEGSEWLLVFALSLTPLLVCEVEKFCLRVRKRSEEVGEHINRTLAERQGVPQPPR